MENKIAPRSGGMRRFLCAAALLLALIALLYAALCLWAGEDPCSYMYKSYLLQAQAWLKGQTHLEQNYEYLELAVYNGNYYVSFPPVPSVPMLLYTLIWGDDVPGGLFQKIYIAIAALLILSELLRSGRMKWGDCVLWALFLCLASAMLPIGMIGGVWYEAQILAFLLSVAAIVAIRRGHVALSCLCYALSVGCRPVTVCLGPVLLMLYLEDGEVQALSAGRRFRRLLPGLIVGLTVAACYCAYNYVRFGNPLEFGHNYLPEFTRSEHGQFSLHYIAQNWRTLFFGAPFHVEEQALRFESFGFSMFLSCPILLCNLIWLVKDLALRRMTRAKLVILMMGALNVLLLMMHRTLGGLQFGMRYALELVPLCFAWLLFSPDRTRLTRWESALMSLGLVLNLVGGVAVHV